MIYLIGKTGAACTLNEDMARAMIKIAGYHSCTESEYFDKLREIKALDTAIAEEETDR